MSDTWSKLVETEPELILTSTALTVAAMGESFCQFMTRMKERREEDGVKEPHILFFFVNATNGYVRATWHQRDETVTGSWAYTLELPARWNQSLEDKAGSTGFDDDVVKAVRQAVEIELPSGLVAMARTELGGAFYVS